MGRSVGDIHLQIGLLHVVLPQIVERMPKQRPTNSSSAMYWVNCKRGDPTFLAANPSETYSHQSITNDFTLLILRHKKSLPITEDVSQESACAVGIRAERNSLDLKHSRQIAYSESANG